MQPRSKSLRHAAAVEGRWRASAAYSASVDALRASIVLQAHGGVKSPRLSWQQQSKVKRRQPRLPKQELNNGRFQQCTPPTGRCSLLGSVVHSDSGLSVAYGTRAPRLARVAYIASHIAQLSRIVARAQSEDECWIRVPRLARVTYIAQLSRRVTVRSLKTNDLLLYV